MRHLRIKVPVPEPRFPEGSFRVRHRYGALCENPEAPVDLDEIACPRPPQFGITFVIYGTYLLVEFRSFCGFPAPQTAR